jgi:metal-responsive CopG/Arc/MetJ family transcriptional regulator
MAKIKTGVYLDQQLLDELDDIAKSYDMSRNKTIRLACRYLMMQLENDSFDWEKYIQFTLKRYGKIS